MKRIIVLLSLTILITSCAQRNVNQSKEVNKKLETKEKTIMKKPVATILFKDLGALTFELQTDQAPQSVYNFTELANNGFYDGLTMHRIVTSFVAQGGDPLGTGTGGPGYSIKGEFISNHVDNHTGHDFGTLAFARSTSYDSAGSQFYIVTGHYDQRQKTYMDNDYAAFGKLLEGHELVERINAEYASAEGIPFKPLIIDSIVVDTLGEQLPSPDKLK